jgi:hypothetical protein
MVKKKKKKSFFIDFIETCSFIFTTLFIYLFRIVSFTLSSRSLFSGDLPLTHSGGFLPISLFNDRNDLIGNHGKTIPI